MNRSTSLIHEPILSVSNTDRQFLSTMTLGELAAFVASLARRRNLPPLLDALRQCAWQQLELRTHTPRDWTETVIDCIDAVNLSEDCDILEETS